MAEILKRYCGNVRNIPEIRGAGVGDGEEGHFLFLFVSLTPVTPLSPSFRICVAQFHFSKTLSCSLTVCVVFFPPPCSASGASVVAIDNKIEQAMVSPDTVTRQTKTRGCRLTAPSNVGLHLNDVLAPFCASVV